MTKHEAVEKICEAINDSCYEGFFCFCGRNPVDAREIAEGERMSSQQEKVLENVLAALALLKE